MLAGGMLNRGLLVPLRVAQYYCVARLTSERRAKLLSEPTRAIDRTLARLATMELGK